VFNFNESIKEDAFNGTSLCLIRLSFSNFSCANRLAEQEKPIRSMKKRCLCIVSVFGFYGISVSGFILSNVQRKSFVFAWQAVRSGSGA
jgi:hypothetical protein